MTEIEIISGRMNEMIDPSLHIWGLDVAAYLFLGGLAAGLMIIPSAKLLIRGNSDRVKGMALPLLLVSVLLSVGMLFLFLDLEYKLHVYRFYLTFQPTSPMSWGAWILLFVYPVSLLLGVSRLFHEYDLKPMLNTTLQKLLDRLMRFDTVLAWLNIIFGISLGIYTGILLSAFVARPLWNSGSLAVLFLVSGLSTGAALLLLLTRDSTERHQLSKLDIILLSIELFVIFLLFQNLSSSPLGQSNAVALFLGGPFTAFFWVLVVGLGMIVPLALELLELMGKKLHLAVPAILVLVGGFLLRVFLLYGGQAYSYLAY